MRKECDEKHVLKTNIPTHVDLMLLKVQFDKAQCETTEAVPSSVFFANSYTNQTVTSTL